MAATCSKDSYGKAVVMADMTPGSFRFNQIVGPCNQPIAEPLASDIRALAPELGRQIRETINN